MASNERHNAKAETTAADEPVSRDTWPVPPPHSTIVTTGGPLTTGSPHDTIPTPPPDPNDDLADIEIPTLRGLDLQNALADAGGEDEKMQHEGTKTRSED